MTPFEQAVAEIEIYGFTLVPEVLDPGEIEALRSALIRSAGEVGMHGYENRNATSTLVANLPARDPVFFQVIDHPAILPILEHFLDRTLSLGSLSSRIVRMAASMGVSGSTKIGLRVITRSTDVRSMSRPSATTRVTRSRSVSTPINWPSSTITTALTL